METMKKMMEKMSKEERVRMMERCFEFMKEKESGKDKEREEKEREESACVSDMGKVAERCPELMETFFLKMKGCFKGKGKEEKNDTGEKTEIPGCC